MLEQAGEWHTSRLTVIPQRTEAEKDWGLAAEQSAAVTAEMAGESMQGRTTKAVVHISMDCRARLEHCVTEYTVTSGITVQSAVLKPIRGKKKKTVDVESSIHLMGYGKVRGESLLWLFVCFFFFTFGWRACACVYQS